MPVADAQARLLNGLKVLPAERVALSRALGRTLAVDISAPYDLPSFVNSSMDGFAVRAAEVAGAGVGQAVVLTVAADVAAGSAEYSGNLALILPPGQTMRIMTGAPLPEGADAVVPVENTDCGVFIPGAPPPERVGILLAVEPGHAVRPRGQDVGAGTVVLTSGRLLRAQEIGLLAALGVAQPAVCAQPRLGLLSTGDELQTPGEALLPGQIYDSNTQMLAALVTEAGGLVVSQSIARDQPGAIQSALDAAVDAGADLLLSSAGVSAGAFDYVRQVVESAGVLDFWRVNMRPGKPLAFGSYRDVPIIGLPGNPVSAFVGFSVFVRPALFKLSGRPRSANGRLLVRLAEAVESDGRESYLRATVWRSPGAGGEWWARLSGHQGSANLYALTQANAFIIVPSEVKSLPSGAMVEAWLLGTAEELDFVVSRQDS